MFLIFDTTFITPTTIQTALIASYFIPHLKIYVLKPSSDQAYFSYLDILQK